MPRIKKLERLAPEEGTYGIKFTFKDEIDNSDIIPTTLYWWLSDLDGEIINGRSEVEVTTITNPYYLVLSGADLQMKDVTDGSDFRVVTLKGTYNSTLGNDLPLTYSCMFELPNMIIIAGPVYVSVIDHAFVGEYLDVQ